MGRMSREEYRMWRQEPVDVPIVAVLQQTQAALVLLVKEGAVEREVPVGMSVIENLDELQRQMRRTTDNQRKAELSVTVPRWLAIDNGWEDEEPDE